MHTVENAAYCYRCSMVCVSVCLLDTAFSRRTKTDEATEMPSWGLTRVDPVQVTII